MRIAVRERSTAEIGEIAYRTLENAAEFWTLAEEGVFTLLRSKGRKFGLRASAYVGQFSIGEDFHVQVTEKVPGAVAGLIRCSAPDDLRTLLAPSLHGEADTLLAEFARQLTRAVGRYVSQGRVKAYVPLTSELSIPKGRINVRASAERFGRGKKGKLVCTRNFLSADLPVNQLIGLALSAAESFLSGFPDHAETVALCRMYSPLFEDVRWRWVAKQPTRIRDALFTSAFAEVRRGTDLYIALGYARALILHLGAWAAEEEGALTPHSYFVNLETLFENAVRQSLQELIGRDKVQRGVDRKTPMFAELADRYIVDPDIVINDGGLTALDCKYKDLVKYPDHSDVYQLAAHAQALGAKRAVLVQPGESPALLELGTTATGLLMSVAQVRPHELQSDLETLANALAPVGPDTTLAVA